MRARVTHNESGPLRVLACPAGYSISDKTGSDPGILYGLLSSLGREHPLSVFAVVNQCDVEVSLPKPVKLLSIGIDLRGSMIEQVLFRIQAFRTGKKLASQFKPQILHQMGSIAYGASFSLLALFGSLDIPFVMGPIMHNVPMSRELADEVRTVRWGRSWLDRRTPSELASQMLFERIMLAASPLMQRLFVETMEVASRVVVVNQFTRDAYRRFVSSKKILVIPPGINTELFAYSKLGKHPNLLAIGQLFRRKGFDYAVKAMPMVLREIPQAQLHIVGDGPQRSNLAKLAKDLNVEDNVHFHGRIPWRRLPSVYEACRVICLPVLDESFGMATLEAMASGRPVISTDAVGPREIIQHGKTGLLVPMADSNALANAIIELLSNSELSSRMSIEARKEVEMKYDWRVIGNCYYELYRKLAS